MNRFAPYFLIVAIIALSVLLYDELTQGSLLTTSPGFEDTDGVLAVNRAQDTPDIQLQRPIELDTSLEAGDGQQEQQFEDMVTRPLFRPGRRPAPPVAEPGAAPESVPKRRLAGFTLVGAILTEDEQAAFLREPSTGKLHILRLGDRLRGYEVIVINADGLVLRSGDDQVKFKLRD